jgi:hypothetical protein
MASPFGAGQMIGEREYLDQTGFVATATLLIDGACAIEWCRGFAQRGEAVM